MNFQVYQVVQINRLEVNERKNKKPHMINNTHPGLRKLLTMFGKLFQE